jgi:ech hydrogenase subunit F
VHGEVIDMPWMFPTICKNLFSKPATRRYPFKDIREPAPGYRGKIHFDREKCTLCGACARICPANAIVVNRDAKTIDYNPFRCIYCSSCVEACPFDAITQDIHYAPPLTEKSVEIISDIVGKKPKAKA